MVINEESLEFKKVAKAVVENFTGYLISKRKLNNIIDASYKNFPSREIVPLKKITDNITSSLEILIDKSFDRFADVFAAAGHPNSIFKISTSNLIKITNGKILDISE